MLWRAVKLGPVKASMTGEKVAHKWTTAASHAIHHLGVQLSIGACTGAFHCNTHSHKHTKHAYVYLFGLQDWPQLHDLSAAFLTACLGLKPTKRFPLSILYLDILGHLGIDCAAPPEFAAKPSRSEELHIAFDGRLISEQSRGELHDCDESPPRGLVRWVDDGFVILIYIYWCISHIHTYIHIQMNIYIYIMCVCVCNWICVYKYICTHFLIFAHMIQS